MEDQGLINDVTVRRNTFNVKILGLPHDVYSTTKVIARKAPIETSKKRESVRFRKAIVHTWLDNPGEIGPLISPQSKWLRQPWSTTSNLVFRKQLVFAPTIPWRETIGRYWQLRSHRGRVCIPQLQPPTSRFTITSPRSVANMIQMKGGKRLWTIKTQHGDRRLFQWATDITLL
jgi:hypothetical protein